MPIARIYFSLNVEGAIRLRVLLCHRHRPLIPNNPKHDANYGHRIFSGARVRSHYLHPRNGAFIGPVKSI